MPAPRDWYTTDFYKALGVSPTATEKEIRRTYRKLAKESHPDAHPGSEERFKEVSAAYEVLGDADKRKEYDAIRTMGPLGGFATGGGVPGGQDGGFSFNLDDVFGNIFGQRDRQRRSSGPGPRRGHDLEAELYLSFQDAVEGVVTSVNVASGAVCTNCGGSGARPGTSPVTCPTCGGLGVLNEPEGMFQLSRTCPDCHGRGTVVKDPCPVCHGSGVEQRQRQVRVRIPAGVEDGQRIRVKGRGAPGANGGPAGDLYVVVHVASHRLFGRRGRNLTLTVPITFPEATLGAQITVPSLEGSVTLKVPPGTRQGQTFRVKGKGLKSAKAGGGSGGAGGAGGSSSDPIGDLLVKVDVQVPSELNDEQKRAVEALARTLPDAPREHLGV